MHHIAARRSRARSGLLVRVCLLEPNCLSLVWFGLQARPSAARSASLTEGEKAVRGRERRDYFAVAKQAGRADAAFCGAKHGGTVTAYVCTLAKCG